MFHYGFQARSQKELLQGFYQFLSKIETGEEFLTKINPHSDKSGAVMRATPIGILPTPERVIKATNLQAAITHNTPDGINAAIAAVINNHSLSQLLQQCVAFTGDVDTVAAIALDAASCSQEYQLDIPTHLFQVR